MYLITTACPTAATLRDALTQAVGSEGGTFAVHIARSARQSVNVLAPMNVSDFSEGVIVIDSSPKYRESLYTVESLRSLLSMLVKREPELKCVLSLPNGEDDSVAAIAFVALDRDAQRVLIFAA